MDLESSDQERRDLEYATQFFEFTPDSFIETVTSTSSDIIDDQLKNLRLRLEEKFRGQFSSNELNDCFSLIAEQYSEATGKVHTSFGKYLKNNILCIPKHVLLPEDKVHSGKVFTGEDMDNSLKTVDNLCLKVRNAKYKRAVLQAKLENLKKVSLRQEKLLQEITNLKEQKDQMEVLFDRQTQVLCEKVESLRPLVEKLENNSTQEIPAPKVEDRKRKFEPDDRVLEKILKMEDEDSD